MDDSFQYNSVDQYLKSINYGAGVKSDDIPAWSTKLELAVTQTVDEDFVKVDLRNVIAETSDIKIGDENQTNTNENIFQSEMSAEPNLKHGTILKLVNLPPNCAEYEAMSVCTPFGIMVRFQIDVPRREAYVEYASTESASQMVEYASKNQLKLVNYQIYVRASDLSAIYVPADHELTLKTLLGHLLYVNPSKTLHFVVTGINQLLNLDDVHFLFSLCGIVSRIIMFSSNDKHQTLVEMHNVEQAITIKFYLDQKPYFTGQGQMLVSFSKNQELQILGKNASNSRDYTVFPSVDTVEIINYEEGKKLEIMDKSKFVDTQAPKPYQPVLNPCNQAPGQVINQVPVRVNNQYPAPMNNQYPAPMNNQFPVYANNQYPIYLNNQFTQPIGGPAPPALYHGSQNFRIIQPYGRLNTPDNQVMQTTYPQLDHYSSPVIVISGMPNGFKLKDVKNLYLNYGNMTKLKILYTRQDTFMVEFTDPLFAEAAVRLTDKFKMGDYVIKANRTRHAQLIVKVTDNPDQALYLLVEESENRFSSPDPEILKALQPPSNCLGITGFPTGFSEDDIKDLFESQGYELCSIVSIMSELVYVVTLGSTLLATKAMGSLNNYKAPSFTTALRIAYSRI